MSIWISAWAGDNAGAVIGRQPYQALVALTQTAPDDDFTAFYQKGDLDGTPWYWEIDAICLTPGAMSAIVTKIDDMGGYVWGLEVTPWNWGGESPKEPWQPGVHLFSILMPGAGANLSGTIATVVVPKARKAISLSDQAVEKMLNVSRQTRLRYRGRS